jgi:hypothetical protein
LTVVPYGRPTDVRGTSAGRGVTCCFVVLVTALPRVVVEPAARDSVAVATRVRTPDASGSSSAVATAMTPTAHPANTTVAMVALRVRRRR